ncbi:hypothetical protein [Tardiphaga robiniae]|uniref:hypothetical protein n=1 Tax=Tardiphaga robiniae TaxID=943830 RepID=UPI001609D012|nr:hypothetical protein [Tardiphaga robiniae]
MHTPLYPEGFGATKRPDRRRNRVVRRTVTIPDRVGPHVKLVFAEMARLGVTYDEVEEGSGVRRASVKAWRKKNRPGLENLQAVLGFLEWDFAPVPTLQALPPDLAGELTALALKLQLNMPATWAAVTAVGVQQALLNMSIAERRAVLDARSARRKRAANDNTKRRALAS